MINIFMFSLRRSHLCRDKGLGLIEGAYEKRIIEDGKGGLNFEGENAP